MFLELLEDFPQKLDGLDFQRQAREKALKVGFPTKKTEKYKYFPVQNLSNGSFTYSMEGMECSVQAEGVEVLPLSLALEKYGLVVRNRFEKMLAKEESFFALLNKGCSNEPLCLFVNQSTSLITIKHRFENSGRLFCQGLQIFVAKGVETSFHHAIEVKGTGNCINCSVDVAVEKNARVIFYQTTSSDADNTFLLDTKVTVKANGSFSHKSAAAGSDLFRNEIFAYLLEKGANCDLLGFWNGSARANISTLAHISHMAENTTSRQHYQGASDQKARASFEGQIYVDKVAQKTDSYQLSKHLLIGEDSKGFSKPNLEVFADDVKASHGATVSMLDEESLFYLTSRGIAKQTAEALLKRSFLTFFLDEIKEEGVHKSFTGMIEG